MKVNIDAGAIVAGIATVCGCTIGIMGAMFIVRFIYLGMIGLT